MLNKFFSTLAISSSLLMVVSCGNNNKSQKKVEADSSVDVVNMPHTNPKWQSIGNCWAYAFAGWAESIVLGATNGAQSLNISESFITYKHFEGQILRGSSELQTGGFFAGAANTTLRSGVIMEGDFIPGESDKTFSAVQKSAVDYLNNSLKSGALSKSRDQATVRAELDKAFNVDSSVFTSKLVKATSLPGGVDAQGNAMNLAQKIQSMQSAFWTGNAGSGATSKQPIVYNSNRTASEQAVLRRMMKALNDGHPVVIDWFVDFNALDNNGIFSKAQLEKRGNGRQGYHSTVVEDYVVKVKDANNVERIIGEGEASPEDKKLALEKGEILYIVIKNSWGGDERLDRSSYTREGVKGYHRLEADYLFSAIASLNEKTGEYQYHSEALQSIHLPAGY
jgi:hypothetical protein